MEPVVQALRPLHCSPDNCTIAQLRPSATFPLTHDDCSLVWHACTSLAHICHLQLHYYHCHLPFTPTYNGSLHSETHSILPSLAAVVSGGLFVVTFSQPAVAEDEHNCYYVRSGCPQRAAVSGWTSEVGVKRIRAEWQRMLREEGREEADAVDLHICITPPASHPQQPHHHPPASFCLHPPHLTCIVPISRHLPNNPLTPTRPSIRQRLGLPPLHSPQSLQSVQSAQSDQSTDSQYTITSVGGGDTRRGKELEDWRRQLGDGGGGRRCVETEGWMVWLVDERWGRKQRLWQFLLQALTAAG